MKNCMSFGKEFTAALFIIIEPLAALNARFGRTVGDYMILTNAQMLAQKLEGAALYRWSGPAFLAIFDSSLTIGEAEIRARNAAAQRFEKSLTTADNREIMIVVTISCHIQRILPSMLPEAVFKIMDGFMAS